MTDIRKYNPEDLDFIFGHSTGEQEDILREFLVELNDIVEDCVAFETPENSSGDAFDVGYDMGQDDGATIMMGDVRTFLINKINWIRTNAHKK